MRVRENIGHDRASGRVPATGLAEGGLGRRRGGLAPGRVCPRRRGRVHPAAAHRALRGGRGDRRGGVVRPDHAPAAAALLAPSGALVAARRPRMPPARCDLDRRELAFPRGHPSAGRGGPQRQPRPAREPASAVRVDRLVDRLHVSPRNLRQPLGASEPLDRPLSPAYLGRATRRLAGVAARRVPPVGRPLASRRGLPPVRVVRARLPGARRPRRAGAPGGRLSPGAPRRRAPLRRAVAPPGGAVLRVFPHGLLGRSGRRESPGPVGHRPRPPARDRARLSPPSGCSGRIRGA